MLVAVTQYFTAVITLQHPCNISIFVNLKKPPGCAPRIELITSALVPKSLEILHPDSVPDVIPGSFSAVANASQPPALSGTPLDEYLTPPLNSLR